jgi:hypothetical protein
MNQLFYAICESGNITSAQRFYQTFISRRIDDIQCDLLEAFQSALYSGEFPILHWLYELRGGFPIPIDWGHENEIVDAIGHSLELAKWMYNLNPIEFLGIRDYVFEVACCSGNLDLAQWLYNEAAVGKINLHFENNSPLQFAIQRGHMDLTQWLYSLGEYEREIDSNTYKIALNRGHISFAKWLYEQRYDQEIVI